jgi:hypothetical protein
MLGKEQKELHPNLGRLHGCITAGVNTGSAVAGRLQSAMRGLFEEVCVVSLVCAERPRQELETRGKEQTATPDQPQASTKLHETAGTRTGGPANFRAHAAMRGQLREDVCVARSAWIEQPRQELQLCGQEREQHHAGHGTL